MNTSSIRQYLNVQSNRLSSIYPLNESKEMILRLAEDYLSLSRPQLLMAYENSFEDYFKDDFEALVLRLLNYEPIQYVVGYVDFYGCRFKVTPDVLIPRPETEEIVDMIVADWERKSAKLIDLGTGSGCIAISLAKALGDSDVMAVDISDRALAIAKENARNSSVAVKFVLSDLRTFHIFDKFDVIVSNPPYVMESEKVQMRNNVLEHEPHLALFVSDTDPLEFYRSIAEFASTNLNPNGKVYMEINQQFGNETAKLFKDVGMNAIVRKDMFGVDRFVVAGW